MFCPAVLQIWRLDCDSGTAHHVAGTGEQGPAGDGGPAKDAKLTGPKGIALGKDQQHSVAWRLENILL